MTKTQLRKWLEQQHTKAIRTNTDNFLKKKEEHREKLYKELNLYEIAEKVQMYLDMADGLVKDWKNNYNVEGVEYLQGYNSLYSALYDFVKGENATFNKMKNNEFVDKTKELFNIEQEFKATRDEINRNYNNLIENIKNLKTAKIGMEYLEGLGFDLTELKKQDEKPVTALVAEIDSKYLFIGQGIKSEN